MKRQSLTELRVICDVAG